MKVGAHTGEVGGVDGGPESLGELPRLYVGEGKGGREGEGQAVRALRAASPDELACAP